MVQKGRATHSPLFEGRYFGVFVMLLLSFAVGSLFFDSRSLSFHFPFSGFGVASSANLTSSFVWLSGFLVFLVISLFLVLFFFFRKKE